MISKANLIAFEADIAAEFEAGRIHAPVHLSGGNEDQLIRIFESVQPEDWIFSTWRSHYHALLKGIPADWLKAEIMAGRSMYICNKEYKFLSSAIVGGILPIALGVAWSIKRQGLRVNREPLHASWCNEETPQNHICSKCFGHGAIGTGDEHVWCFVGDMAAETGLFHEVQKYSSNWDLPMRIIIEDNGLSTNTPTAKVWARNQYSPSSARYLYRRQWPHVGMGKFITFG